MDKFIAQNFCYDLPAEAKSSALRVSSEMMEVQIHTLQETLKFESKTRLNLTSKLQKFEECCIVLLFLTEDKWNRQLHNQIKNEYPTIYMEYIEHRKQIKSKLNLPA